MRIGLDAVYGAIWSVCAAVVLAIAVALYQFSITPDAPDGFAAVAFGTGVVAVFVLLNAVIGTTLIGVPVFTIATRYRVPPLPFLVVAGALFGAAAQLFWVRSDDASEAAPSMILFAAFGVCGGFAFWVGSKSKSVG
jgi:hypothetical protein